MSDLIRRKALCDYISAAYYDDRFNDPVVLLDELFERAKHFPAVDAVAVVRCRDCNSYNGHRYCTYLDETVLDDDFCSFGERREDNE